MLTQAAATTQYLYGVGIQLLTSKQAGGKACFDLHLHHGVYRGHWMFAPANILPFAVAPGGSTHCSDDIMQEAEGRLAQQRVGQLGLLNDWIIS